MEDIEIHRFGIIYIHIVASDDGPKSYIGQTIQGIEKRIRHGYEHGIVGKAIEKYGWNKITTRIIGIYPIELLNYWEIYYINHFSTKTPHGYNLTDGGDSFQRNTSVSLLQSSRDNVFIRRWNSIAEAARALNIGYGAISACLHGTSKTGGGFIWKYEIEKTAPPQKLNENFLKASIEAAKVPITQLTRTRDIVNYWGAIVEASRVLNISENGIRQCLSGRTKSSAGFLWEYTFPKQHEKYNPDINKDSIEKSKNPVFQLLENGEFVAEWPSATDASKALSINRNSIYGCLRKKQILAGGFKWEYKNSIDKFNITDSMIILQVSFDGKLVKEWTDIFEINKAINVSTQNISKCLSKKNKTAYGFLWIYKTEDIDINVLPIYKKCYHVKSILQCDQYNKEIVQKWGSTIEAATALGINRETISACLRGKQKTGGGFIWEYENKDSASKISKYKHNKQNHVSFLQLTEDGKSVRKWNSVDEAGNELKINAQGIIRCLNGKKKTCGGFRWEYAPAEDNAPTEAK